MFGAIAVGLLSVLLWFVYWCYEQRRKFRPIDVYPGPKPLPLLGSSLEFGMDPVERLKSLCDFLHQYGPNTRVYVGPNRVFLLSTDPDLAEFILSSSKHIDKSSEYDLFKPWLCNGLLISTGRYWHKRRKVITPTFHFKILDEFLPTVSANANVLTAKLAQQAGAGKFDIYPYITNFTLDSICETSMGTPVNAQEKPDNEYVRSVKTLCNIINARAFSSWQMFDALFKWSSSFKIQNKCLEVLHGFTMNVINKRRAQIAANPNNIELTDEFGKKRRVAFLDLLLQAQVDGKPLTNSDVREEVDTFMFEGHDTTASGIAFALFALSRNPDVQEKVWNELHELFGDEKDLELSQADMGNMKYTELVIKETLRLFPPVPFFARKLSEDVVYKDTVLPKDVQITFMVFDMHRRADFFKDPEKFNPDRFLPDSGDTRHPFAYLPFSAGPRNCIGQKFAMQEMKMALYKILINYKVLPAEGFKDLVLSGEVILKSANGVPVRLEKRQ